MFKLTGAEKLFVGIDISDRYTQISYCSMGGEGEVETLSTTAGSEKFNIPTVLCKKPKVNQWFIGREALQYAEEGNGILIKNLIGLAMDQEPVQIEGTDVDPVSLLALFLKKCIGFLTKLRASDRMEAVMFTCKDPDKRFKEVLIQAAEGLRVKSDRIFFQSYSECFYDYMLYQPGELWEDTSALIACDGECIRMKFLECNGDGGSVVVHIEEEEYPFAPYRIADMGGNLHAELERMDRGFLDICTESLSSKKLSSIYLIGEEFSTEWMDESLKFLCGQSRVFQGSNLYGKGACYGLLERLRPGERDKKYIFMGKDKLKSEIGMKLLSRGKEIYYPIFEAGMGWYDADKVFECYIQDGNQVDIMISSLIGKGNKLAQIILEELPSEIGRVKCHIHLSDVNHLVVEIEDMGLGTMRPATHNTWKEEIEI